MIYSPEKNEVVALFLDTTDSVQTHLALDHSAKLFKNIFANIDVYKSQVCTVLRREREQEIKRLAEHNEQFRNERTGYENSQVNVSVMLKKNSGYKNLYLYQ